MDLPSYTELRERYSKLSTQELLGIALNSELTEQAQLAMDAELDSRREELATTKVVYSAPVGASLRFSQRFGRWILTVILASMLMLALRYLEPFMDRITG